jgi:hypothetical protein
MTVDEIKKFVMFQTSNDAEDVGEFLPYLLDYINEGYDRLVFAYAKEHVPSTTYPTLVLDTAVPVLPAWTHLGIANWATWCVYRNGNPAKQNRGFQFRAAAEETAAQIRGGSAPRNFYNMPT